MKHLKVLITCGPTWVPIDDVRVISNQSTGEMGHLIAQELVQHQAKVTLLEGPVTHKWLQTGSKVIKYQYFDELQSILKEQLKLNYDVVIHAAAVSDFKVAQVSKTKISSSKKLTLNLVPTVKLIDEIRTHAPNVFLVGFKLDSKMSAASVVTETAGLFKQARCNLVVANSVKNGYKGFIIDQHQHIWLKTDNKKALARGLVRLINQLKFIL
jgi:phosphopantothenoylcysteine decarboxylase / phosphopantothenate---cysteine ligase